MASSIWIVDDDSSIRWVLEKSLSNSGYDCRSFESGEDALSAMEDNLPDIMISDIRMPGIDGLELLSRVHEKDPDIPVIIMTAHSDLSSAVNAYEQGTFEYLPKPFDLDDALALAKRAENFVKENRKSARKQSRLDGDANQTPAPEIVGEAPAMQEVFRAIGRLSKSSITVLINGQSGTGKELVAHALHRHSPRADQPFVALNMAAIPKELIESELFGHEKGSFTGANTAYSGRFEQADGGTLFLDEIGDMPVEAQTRLLRVLADGCFYRVGGTETIKVNVRIIAATNQNLEAAVADGRFREDLYHRLNVIRIHIPALRERRGDIPALARVFLARAAKDMGTAPKILRPETETYLSALPWPGNVRQLQNVCNWLNVMASGQEVHVSDLPAEIATDTAKPKEKESESVSSISWQDKLREWASMALASGETDIFGKAVPEFESVLINAALDFTHNHKQEAAKLLGCGRNTLTRKLHEMGDIR